MERKQGHVELMYYGCMCVFEVLRRTRSKLRPSKSRIRVDLRPLVRSLLASREVERKDSGGNHGQEQGVTERMY